MSGRLERVEQSVRGVRSESAALQAEALQMRSDAAAAEQAFRVVGGGLESTVQRLTEEQAQAQARTQAQLRALELQLAALSERHAATQARLAALTDGGGGGGGGGGGDGGGGGGGDGVGERVASGAVGSSQGERLAAVEARLEGVARLAQQVQHSASRHASTAERLVKVEAA